MPWQPNLQTIPGQGPDNPDPFNWKKIAAALKAEESRKTAAKNRIRNPVGNTALPNAGIAPATQAVAPPPGPTQKELIDAYRAMNNGELPLDITPEMAALIDAQAESPPDQSPKGLLDAFRAMNGGALPPGMTPEQAALIDSGADPGALAGIDPAIAGVISQMQALITGLPAEYAAGKASVNQSYDTLTGDILQSGENWMKDMYGRMVNPNDPNSALVAQDPALTEYAAGMSKLDETSDLNRATDLAWFDKMQANASSTYQGLIAALMAQGAAVPAEDGGGGGGGGGGGRGRGGRGGGSGSGVNNWKIPTNTVTNQQSAEDVAAITDTGFAPGFFEDLMAQTEGNPDLQAMALGIWNQSDQSPRGVTQAIQKVKDAAILSNENEAMREALHQTWTANSPKAVTAAISKMLTNKGAIIGDDPSTPRREPYHVPKVEGQNVPTPIQFSEKQMDENALAEELLANKSRYGNPLASRVFGNGGLLFGAKPGVASPAAILERETKGQISPRQYEILKARGELETTEAAKGDTPEMPFNWQGWSRGGGYVPPADQEKLSKNEQNLQFYNFLLDKILPWNPNAYTVPTKETFTSTGKDSSTYKTATTNKSNAFALPGSTRDLSPDIPEVALQSNPVTNPQGFNITLGESPGDAETVEVSPLGLGGYGPTAKLPTKGNLESLQNLNQKTVQKTAKEKIRSLSADLFGKPKKTAAPAPVKTAPAKPTTNLNTRLAASTTKFKPQPKDKKTGEIFGLKIPEKLKAPAKKPAVKYKPKKSTAK